MKSDHTFVDTDVTEIGVWEPTLATTEVEERVATKVKVERPSMFKVVLLNDDFTPMDFVVDVLMHIFHKSRDEAVEVMMQVHERGAGVCGVYTRDVAETKAELVITQARRQDHPLQCVVERA